MTTPLHYQSTLVEIQLREVWKYSFPSAFRQIRSSFQSLQSYGNSLNFIMINYNKNPSAKCNWHDITWSCFPACWNGRNNPSLSFLSLFWILIIKMSNAFSLANKQTYLDQIQWCGTLVLSVRQNCPCCTPYHPHQCADGLLLGSRQDICTNLTEVKIKPRSYCCIST